jgi:hypothetical protein
MSADLTQAREALATMDRWAGQAKDRNRDLTTHERYVLGEHLCAALARVDELEARNAALERLEASQHKARARDVAAIAGWLREEAEELSTERGQRIFMGAADAIERGDWHDGVLPPDPRDERLAALEAEVAILRACLTRLFTAYGGDMLRPPGDHACARCVGEKNVIGDSMIEPGFACPYHTGLDLLGAKDRAGPVPPPPPTTLTWLGAHPRRTLWRTSTDEAECLGWIILEGTTWGAYLHPSEKRAEPRRRRFRGYDDDIAAARALCAYLRVGDVALPTLTDRDDK